MAAVHPQYLKTCGWCDYEYLGVGSPQCLTLQGVTSATSVCLSVFFVFNTFKIFSSFSLNVGSVKVIFVQHPGGHSPDGNVQQ